MAVWRLYRHHNSDGSSKDWAVQTNADGSLTTRWGKTANHLPGLSTRRGIRQFDIERAKQAKGYVFVAEVEIDSDGQVFLPGHVMPEPLPSVGTLYWHIECRNNPESRTALASEVRPLFTVMPSLFDKETMPNQYWGDWLPLLDLSISDQPFIQSGQIKQTDSTLLQATSFTTDDLDALLQTSEPPAGMNQPAEQDNSEHGQGNCPTCQRPY
jgi:hypothetical protein